MNERVRDHGWVNLASRLTSNQDVSLFMQNPQRRQTYNFKRNTDQIIFVPRQVLPIQREWVLSISNHFRLCKHLWHMKFFYSLGKWDNKQKNIQVSLGNFPSLEQVHSGWSTICELSQLKRPGAWKLSQAAGWPAPFICFLFDFF